MRKRQKKIALVLDNCTAHPNVSGLTNIMLVFLPPNTTAKTQPMDTGVIRNIKAHYRKNLAKLRLLAFEKKTLQDRYLRFTEASQSSLEFSL